MLTGGNWKVMMAKILLLYVLAARPGNMVCTSEVKPGPSSWTETSAGLPPNRQCTGNCTSFARWPAHSIPQPDTVAGCKQAAQFSAQIDHAFTCS